MVMGLENLHLMQDDKLCIVYNATTLELVSVDKQTFEILSLLRKNCTFHAVAQQLGISKEICEEKYSNFQNLFSEQKTLLDNQNNTQGNIRNIERITLHVANDCNLRCKYCYADGGHYKDNRSMMTLQVAAQFIEFCRCNFEEVGMIVFFGGEPMLNLPVMKFVCSSIKQLYKEGKYPFCPQFGIITNGTILNAEVLDFIKEHLTFITVSVDGTKKQHDANRVFADGRGSYAHVKKFIRTVLAETDVKVMYEATFTQYHIDHGYTLLDVEKALVDEFGITGKVVEELSIQPECRDSNWADFNYENWKRNGKIKPEGFDSVLSVLSSKKAKTMCGAGHTMFAVSAEGMLYPCHIDSGDRTNCMGSIFERNAFNDSQIRKNCFPVEWKQNESCISCWANTVCGGCSRTWFRYGDKDEYAAIPRKDLCEWNRKHLECLLLLMANIRKDKALWQKMVEDNGK